LFGYIVVNQQEMKYKEYDEYHRYYCGLCKALKDCRGGKGQLSLSYDMTFLVILLTGLYEPENVRGMRRCVPHPIAKHEYIENEFTAYVAEMNLILTYYKCMDDWQDEKKLSRKIFASAIWSKDMYAKWQDKIDIICDKLNQISLLEKENSDDLDKLSGYFGEVMSEICAPRHDEWEDNLRRMGYYLGRFVYIIDAYDDIEKDIKKGQFNPLISRLVDIMYSDGYKGVVSDNEQKSIKDIDKLPPEVWKEFAQHIKEILMLQAAECAREFEKLPILENVEILRNILYSGIWSAYYKATNNRMEKKQK
jgi:hypothetical protein